MQRRGDRRESASAAHITAPAQRSKLYDSSDVTRTLATGLDSRVWESAGTADGSCSDEHSTFDEI